MPAWWARKSGKSKDDSHNRNRNQIAHNQSPRGVDRRNRGIISGESKTSLDEPVTPTRGTPRCSRDFAGFDSDSGEKRGHPLPRPSVSSIHSDHGSGSGSVSSVSSSGSADDQGQLGSCRGNGDLKFNIAPPRSPGRCSPRPTSPLHYPSSGVILDSPAECHPLPLPPSSPTSPSAVHGSRTGGGSETSSPHSVSKWKKGKLLGRGTFGQVYQGFNSEKGKMCAIKEVRVISDDQTSRECLKQLNQEINLLSQLSHPNIVQYYGSELSEETLSVYLEYVSGGSIHKLLQEYGAFTEPVIQNYTRQILAGLAYLHGRNTVHRDIKGANILVDPNGEIKLADFGMAKHITACSSMLSFKGSPYWMAPEVVMNTNGYNLAVDIWSLGCTILEMATAKPPWSHYEGVAAIFKIGNSKDIPEIPDQLSDDAKNFIRLCLQRDPSKRPTASQLLEHSFLREHTMRVTNASMTKDTSPHASDRSRALQPTVELYSRRSSHDNYAQTPLAVSSRAIKSPSRENVRAIASLPVSPCSSPLRQNGPAYKSCFLSPHHPSFPFAGQDSNYNLSEFAARPFRANTAYTNDKTMVEPSMFRPQTPDKFMRSRLL
ncbi:PREDICTED: mitogen-activated protein kinase kinase kinase YODA-like isoform X3 [Tarenaya hassleriana]|uniref:mitogen-activated protein kinase kinase kinase YODA-like isoform X3 n=1 Tax=Tarenaya hassleriana TaxID=28532 RepID=UPI00053C10A6|nr:PREDICTED: mitogen-activated protein kinase kinase kinase YODA-like isoform X3 [Tarenaya hassleriana]